jgi:PhzF family phenazine biosynthesis protein
VAQRQEVARQIAVSETAFVLRSGSADFKLEFYTPTRPIPHCGHATVGTFARLAALGRLNVGEVVNETVDGPRRIRIEGERAFMEQVPAKLTRLDDATTLDVLGSLSIGTAQLRTDGGPFLADNGNRSIQIGVADTAVLRDLKPNLDAIRDITNRFDAVCYYVFASESVVPGRDATARMFGPAYGIPEESATGMAAGPLALWLDARSGGRRETFAIEQGQMMSPASPSLIIARPQRSGDALSAMWIGGSARARGVRQIRIQ